MPSLLLLRSAFFVSSALPLVFASSNWNRFAPRAEGFQWQPCEGVSDTRITCSFYEIPLDYNNETVGKGQLWVSKFSPSGATTIGTIFSNPGGPGGSGVELITTFGETISNHSGNVYDIISWDPRGVGNQTIPSEISCYDSNADYLSYWQGTLQNPTLDVRGNFTLQSDIDYFYSQVDVFDAKIKGLKSKCAGTSTGKYGAYVGTAATVRDMVSMADAIQGANTTINFWGFSYGTIIGSYFVNMFPNRVGRVIIDGVVDPITWSAGRADLSWGQDLGSVDETFQGFAMGCELAGASGCKLADPAVNGGKGVMKLLQDSIDTIYDLHKAKQTQLTGLQVRFGIHQALYHPDEWASFANVDASDLLGNLTQIQATGVRKGNGASRRHTSLFRHFFSSVKPRQLAVNGAPSNTMDMITCGDSVDSTTTTKQVFDELLRVTQNVSGTFGPQFPQPRHGCHIWPTRAVERFSGPWNATLNNPILVIGNKADPITPFAEAKGVADMLGDSAILLEQNGFGHTSIAERSACMQAITVEYFVNGNHPVGDATSCGVDDTAELFPVNGGKGITALAISTALKSSQMKKRLLR